MDDGAKIVAGDYEFSIVNGDLHRSLIDGSPARGCGGPERVPEEELSGLPDKVLKLLHPDN